MINDLLQGHIQGDQLYMALSFWYLVKRNLCSTEAYTGHVTFFTRYERHTVRLSGQVAYAVKQPPSPYLHTWEYVYSFALLLLDWILEFCKISCCFFFAKNYIIFAKISRRNRTCVLIFGNFPILFVIIGIPKKISKYHFKETCVLLFEFVLLKLIFSDLF